MKVLVSLFCLIFSVNLFATPQSLEVLETRWQSEEHGYHQCGVKIDKGWYSSANDSNCFVDFGPYTNNYQKRRTGKLLAKYSVSGDSSTVVTFDVVDISRKHVYSSTTVRGLDSSWQIVVLPVDFDGAGNLELRVYKHSGPLKVNWKAASYIPHDAKVYSVHGDKGQVLARLQEWTFDKDILIQARSGKGGEAGFEIVVKEAFQYNNNKGKYKTDHNTVLSLRTIGNFYGRVKAQDQEQNNTIYIVVEREHLNPAFEDCVFFSGFNVWPFNPYDYYLFNAQCY